MNEDLCHLRLLSHPEDVLSAQLADEVGVIAPDMRLGGRYELVVGVPSDDLAALAIDQLPHGSPLLDRGIVQPRSWR